jgi:hypothetical protein
LQFLPTKANGPHHHTSRGRPGLYFGLCREPLLPAPHRQSNSPICRARIERSSSEMPRPVRASKPSWPRDPPGQCLKQRFGGPPCRESRSQGCQRHPHLRFQRLLDRQSNANDRCFIVSERLGVDIFETVLEKCAEGNCISCGQLRDGWIDKSTDTDEARAKHSDLNCWTRR